MFRTHRILAGLALPALLLPLRPAIAQEYTLPSSSTSAHDLPVLSNDEEGTRDLYDGIEEDWLLQQAIEQQAGAEQFGDLSPEEWAYQALDDLIQSYDCLQGYPDGTYRGDRPLTRYELAAALNACLQNVERLLTQVTEQYVEEEEWVDFQTLLQEDIATLNELKTRVDSLEARIINLEDNQFSTTTKFTGEVVFAFSDLAINQAPLFLSRGTLNGINLVGLTDNDDAEAVFGGRGRLWMRTSFTGEDLLAIRIDISNLAMLEDANELTGVSILGADSLTGETTQTFNIGFNTPTFETNNFSVFYSRPFGEDIQAHVFANGGLWSDFVPTLNPYFEDYDGGKGALSTFASRNPIYRIGGGAGIGFNFDLDFMESFLGPSRLSLGYLAGPSGTKNPEGLFGGDYAFLAQLDFDITEDFSIGLTYNHGYHPSNTAVFDMGGLGSQGVVGSAISNTASSGSTIPKITNAYGIELAWQLSDAVALSGFFTYIDAHAPAVEAGNYEIWTYGLGIAFPDLFKDDALLGIFVGAQPYVAGFDAPTLTFRNNTVPYHLEIFYRCPITDYVSITPGIIFLTSPNQIKAGAS
ncbi:MAG: iron uptake porin, partial [Spirulina sp.]